MEQEPIGWRPARERLPPATRAILTLTVAVFVVTGLADHATRGGFSLVFGLSVAGLVHGWLWQLVTYMFLHAGLWHLFVNMFVVFMFGRELERVVGARRFVMLYIGSGVLAGLGWALISGSGRGICIGASGGVFGLIGTYAALFPNRPITLLLFFVLPVTLKARTMAILLGAFTFMAMFGGGTVAHSAHLVGGIAGYWYGWRLLKAARRGHDHRLRRYFSDLLTRFSLPRVHPPPRPDWDPSGGQEDAPTADAVNAILDKILLHGVGSLTPAERRLLQTVSRQLNRS